MYINKKHLTLLTYSAFHFIVIACVSPNLSKLDLSRSSSMHRNESKQDGEIQQSCKRMGGWEREGW